MFPTPSFLTPTLAGLFILLLSFSAQASAPAWMSTACLPLAALDKRIHYCSQNKIAVEESKQCASRLLQAWKQAASGLAEIEANPQINQNLQFENSDERYELAAERLEVLIDLLRKNTDLIAEYPKAMVDGVEVTNMEESHPCFKHAFQEIQSVVSVLDKKKIEGIHLWNRITGLHRSTRAAAEGIFSKSAPDLDRKAKKTLAAGSEMFSASQRRGPASDITGTKRLDSNR